MAKQTIKFAELVNFVASETTKHLTNIILEIDSHIEQYVEKHIDVIVMRALGFEKGKWDGGFKPISNEKSTTRLMTYIKARAVQLAEKRTLPHIEKLLDTREALLEKHCKNSLKEMFIREYTTALTGQARGLISSRNDKIKEQLFKIADEIPLRLDVIAAPILDQMLQEIKYNDQKTSRR